jgi:hypothetical protein
MAKLIFAYLEIYKLGICIIPVESTIVSFARPSRTKVPPQAREGPISETGTSHPRSPVSNHPLSSIALLVALGFYCTHIPREKQKTKKKPQKKFTLEELTPMSSKMKKTMKIDSARPLTRPKFTSCITSARCTNLSPNFQLTDLQTFSYFIPLFHIIMP